MFFATAQGITKMTAINSVEPLQTLSVPLYPFSSMPQNQKKLTR